MKKSDNSKTVTNQKCIKCGNDNLRKYSLKKNNNKQEIILLESAGFLSSQLHIGELKMMATAIYLTYGANEYL